MKKIFLSGCAIIASILSTISQEDVYQQSEDVPLEELVLKKDQIPETLRKTVSKDFTEGKPIEWLNFPNLFQKYGWSIVDTSNYGDPKPEFYSVLIESKDGSKLDAVYTPDGKLVRSREVLKSAALPKEIELAIAKSEYGGWQIVGDRERITDYKNNISKHYIVRVQRNNERKILYLDEYGNILKSKRRI